MAGLINPRPLDPIAMQLQLVDARGCESAVVFVDNGEALWKNSTINP